MKTNPVESLNGKTTTNPLNGSPIENRFPDYSRQMTPPAPTQSPTISLADLQQAMAGMPGLINVCAFLQQTVSSSEQMAQAVAQYAQEGVKFTEAVSCRLTVEE